MWSVVMRGDLTWLMWSDFILKLSKVSYGEVLGDKSAMYTRVTLYWGYLLVLWLFHLGISCNVFVLTYTVVVLSCFLMCGRVCMCGCFGNMHTCIYCVLYCLYCVFVLFNLCIFILICFFTSVRTTTTEWQLNYS
jgi:hypothetical protein